jgi:carbonic anhydrase/acetyltransferase-like protein (isoleucine patch superfamily)
LIAHLPCATPHVADSAFIAPDAWVIGDVSIAEDCSVFFGAVLRGDIEKIVVGARTNIQEHSVVHTSHGRGPVVIGEDVTVGHRAIIHGARIGDRVLVGMGSILLDEAVIESESVIAAGALIKEGMLVPSHSLVMGVPGKIVRQLTDKEIAFLKISSMRYVEAGRQYKQMSL